MRLRKRLHPLHHLKSIFESACLHNALSHSRQTSLFWRRMTTIPALAAASVEFGCRPHMTQWIEDLREHTLVILAGLKTRQGMAYLDLARGKLISASYGGTGP